MHATSLRRSATAVALALALLFPAMATAQPATDASSGLTVTGFGQASAPADSAVVALTIGSESMSMGPVPVLPVGQSVDDAVAPIVEALVDAGIDQGSIDVLAGPSVIDAISSYGGPPIAVIRFEVVDPSSDAIAAALDAASAIASERGLFVGGMGIRFLSDACDTLQHEAREAAIADAREQARAMAELTGVTPGAMTGVRDVPMGPDSAYTYGLLPFTSGCAPFDVSTPIPQAYGPSAYDPTQEPTVTAYAQVEMTFEIVAGASATPAG